MDITVTRYQVIEMTILVSLIMSCVLLCYVSYGAMFPVSIMTRSIFQTEPEKSFDIMYQLLIYLSEVLRM
jgi:hypothetical protein